MAGASQRIGPAIARYRAHLLCEHRSHLGPVGVSRAVHMAASTEAALKQITDGLNWYIAQMKLLQPNADSRGGARTPVHRSAEKSTSPAVPSLNSRRSTRSPTTATPTTTGR